MPTVVTIDDWPEVQHLTSERLQLETLRPEHADEMAPLLDDVELHTIIGEMPATRDELGARYIGQVVGTTQATVSEQDGVLIADVAWVIGASQQRQGARARRRS